MCKRWIVVLSVVFVMGFGPRARALAVEPADPDLIPEGRRLLDYLVSVEGKKIVSGVQRNGGGQGPFTFVLHASGREPALYGEDIGGFHPLGSEIYHQVRRGVVKKCLFWWQEKGGIVTMAWHWKNPMHPDGHHHKGRQPAGVEPPDVGKMVTPGTEEYEAFHRVLGQTADNLEDLADAHVPIIWRPFHEIDGGWFWWTDSETPENTATLWRQMFDYLVNERGIHNLIWTYHAAHTSHRRGAKDATFEDEIAHRKRFYPGAEYVDMASLSAYGNPKLGWSGPQQENYARAYELMQGVAPGKPLCIAENHGGLLNPVIAQKKGPAWVYQMAWTPGERTWVAFTFNHEHFIKLDELPVFHGGNVMPNVRIDWPTDGLAIGADQIKLAGFAADRNDNLKEVSVLALHGPWLDWKDRGYESVMGMVKDRGELPGKARMGAGGRWTFTWRNIPAGHHQVVALARDTKGAVAHSNVVRMTAGIENLALGRDVTASTTSPWGGPPGDAVDGDPYSMWWSDHREPDPQWLQVDLGSAQKVGAVSVLWWKAYAKDYTVQVSNDGENWRGVARVQDRPKPLGGTDVVRFDPVQARHVRLHFTEPAVQWQHYCIYDFGVYESLPEAD